MAQNTSSYLWSINANFPWSWELACWWHRTLSTINAKTRSRIPPRAVSGPPEELTWSVHYPSHFPERCSGLLHRLPIQASLKRAYPERPCNMLIKNHTLLAREENHIASAFNLQTKTVDSAEANVPHAKTFKSELSYYGCPWWIRNFISLSSMRRHAAPVTYPSVNSYHSGFVSKFGHHCQMTRRTQSSAFKSCVIKIYSTAVGCVVPKSTHCWPISTECVAKVFISTFQQLVLVCGFKARRMPLEMCLRWFQRFSVNIMHNVIYVNEFGYLLFVLITGGPVIKTNNHCKTLFSKIFFRSSSWGRDHFRQREVVASRTAKIILKISSIHGVQCQHHCLDLNNQNITQLFQLLNDKTGVW